MEKETELFIKDNDEKFSDLIKAYNTWMSKTQFMSVGNCNVPEWYDLVACCKNDAKLFAEFANDYIETLGSNWIILTLIDEVIGNPINTESGYINPTDEEVKIIYKMMCKLYAAGGLVKNDDGSFTILNNVVNCEYIKYENLNHMQRFEHTDGKYLKCIKPVKNCIEGEIYKFKYNSTGIDHTDHRPVYIKKTNNKLNDCVYMTDYELLNHFIEVKPNKDNNE